MDDVSCDPPAFVAALDAWVLSRFADVAAALRDPRLSPSPMHEASLGARTAPRESSWLDARTLDDRLRVSASTRVREVPSGSRVDLVGDFAAPWSLDLAASVCGIELVPASTLATLSTLAREAFVAAAHAREAVPAPLGSSAVSELARALASHRALAPLDVQTFVALTHTLPCTLGSVWLALLERPDQMGELRTERARIPRAVEELLRFAGPSRAVFRYAHEQTLIGGSAIAAGARVVLLLSNANRDPSRFADGHRLDVRRDAVGHLAFGRGTHGCVGAGLIRSAVRAATEALLEATRSIELAGEVEWIDGFAIRGVVSLPVRL